MIKENYSLITTDIHLTEKKEDQYRFDLFPWIRGHFGDKINRVFILGDLTDHKNYHADWFVNKIVETIRQLSLHYKVVILKGNHDYDTSPDHPFFSFLGRLSWIEYISEPTYGDDKILYLPHTRNPGADWSILRTVKKPNFILMHQTFRGAISESGHLLSGIGYSRFYRFGCPIYSGDIHMPQQVGPITYVGSPYHTRYGDNFDPRLVMISDSGNSRNEDLYFPAPRKFVFELESWEDLKRWRPDIEKGDMAKIRIHLPRDQFEDWPMHRDKCRKQASAYGLKVHSIVLKEKQTRRGRKKKPLKLMKGRSRRSVYKAFCGRYEVRPDLIEAGQEFME